MEAEQSYCTGLNLDSTHGTKDKQFRGKNRTLHELSKKDYINQELNIENLDPK